MKRSTSDYEGPTYKRKGSAGVVFISLMITGAMIAISLKGFAQNPAIRDSVKATQTGEALTRPRQNAQTPATRRVFVRSKSLLVRAAVVEDKLLKRPEFKQLGFSITREEADADLVLELRHDLLTKYVFSVVDVNTQTVLTGGKVSSLGGTVAGKVAKRFVKEMARASTP